MAIGKTPHGLNTYDPPDRLAVTESSKLLNWMIAKGGEKIPRLPISLYSNSATTNDITYIKRVNIGGTTYELVVDSGYRLYYLDSSLDPTLIGTLEGDATLLNYNSLVLIFDGSYIKYIEDVSTIKIAYDAGGYQFDNTSSIADTKTHTQIDLDDANTWFVGQKFTTQSWDSGYTIPPTSITFYLKTNETISNFKYRFGIRKVSDNSLLGESEYAYAKELPTTSFSAITLNIAAVADMDPTTDYYAYVRSTTVGVTTYFSVYCEQVLGGGLAYTSTLSGSTPNNWVNDSTKNAFCSVGPSLPPKGKHGVTWNNRPWVWGDPDSLGVMHFGNLTHLDWSTTNGGGSLGIVDNIGDAYEVGSAAPFYNDLYVFGVESQPYLVKISGTEPSDYTQNVIFQEPWAPANNIVNSVNELWFSNSDGVSPLSGVNEYGDLRTRTASGQVYDKIRDYFDSSTAFSGYYQRDGQLLLVMPTYHRLLVCHTKLAVVGPDGTGVWYPWSEYEYYRYELTSFEYQWVANGYEYYLQTVAGDPPDINSKPDFVVMDGVVLTEGTAGSLKDHEWDYAQYPGSSYNTIYIKDDTGDPDTSGVDIRTIFLPTWIEQSGPNMLFGGSDKYIYKIDQAHHNDMGSIQINPIWASANIEIPGGYAELSKLQVLATAEAAAVNLITNPEFINSTAGWTAVGAIITSQPSVVSTGSPSGGYNNKCIEVSSYTTNGYASQTFSIVSGGTYNISARSYAPSSNVEVNATEIGVVALGVGVVGTSAGTVEDEWETLRVTVTSVASTELTVFLYANGTNSETFYDIISCNPVPNYSSMDVNFLLDRSNSETGSTTVRLYEKSDSLQEQLFEYISFNGWSFLVETNNVSIGGPIHDDGLLIWYRPLNV